MTKAQTGENFRWDLFLRDYRAYLNRQVRTLKETGHEMNVHPSVLSCLRSGTHKKVGRVTLDRILKGMGMYYEFYCEQT